MKIQHNARDLMHRTMENLRIVDELHFAGDGSRYGCPYEVTQLVNSFLGALAYPWEDLRGGFFKSSVEDARRRWGFPEMPASDENDNEPKNLHQLLRELRNGVAHGNIKFFADSTDEIESIEIWNMAEDRKTKKGYRTWGTRLSVAQLRQFLEAFVCLAEDCFNNRMRPLGSLPCAETMGAEVRE